MAEHRELFEWAYTSFLYALQSSRPVGFDLDHELARIHFAFVSKWDGKLGESEAREAAVSEVFALCEGITAPKVTVEAKPQQAASGSPVADRPPER